MRLTVIVLAGLLMAGMSCPGTGLDEARAQEAVVAQAREEADPLIRRGSAAAGPDMELGECEVLCDRGGGYSLDVCERNGYSDQFKYMVRVKLRNAGERPAEFEPGWTVWEAVYLSRTPGAGPGGVSRRYESSAAGLSLEAGALMSEEVGPSLANLSLAAGSHTVLFEADPDGHISEKTIFNNKAECSWEVVAAAPTAPYDLAVTGLAVFPSTGSLWSEFTLFVSVENFGDAVFDTIETECSLVGSFYDAAIDAGEKISNSAPIPEIMPPGDHTVVCTVRAPGYSERDTANNTRSVVFTVTPF